jgi:hypothetical protein
LDRTVIWPSRSKVIDGVLNDPAAGSSATSALTPPMAMLARTLRPSAFGEVDACTTPLMPFSESQNARYALSFHGGLPSPGWSVRIGEASGPHPFVTVSVIENSFFGVFFVEGAVLAG